MNACKVLIAIALLLFASTGKSLSQESTAQPEMRLRLVPLFEGLRSGTKDGTGIEETKTFKLGKSYGIDLNKPKHPLVAHNVDDRGRLFFVFYNQIDNALGDRPYLIQRVKMTEKFYDLDGKQRPVHTKYLVEAFKTNAGSIKGIDQHFGGYAMGKNTKREILKELEVGYGEIPNVCEGKTWPFDGGKRYKEIQGYGTEESIYDSVRFERSVKWTIRVGLTDKGQYRVRVPELEIDLPKNAPSKEISQPWRDPASRKMMLMAGKGCTGVLLGKSNSREIQQTLGKPLEVVAVTNSDTNYSYSGGITIQVENGNKVSSLFTRPSFAGRTKKGIRLGDSKSKVRKAYGRPKGKPNEWQYKGIVFRFDYSERVKTIFVFPS